MLARTSIIENSKSVADLFRWLQNTIGLDYFGVAYGHAASVCALNLVEFLTVPGVLDMFQTMVVVISKVARRWLLCRGILKLLWITLQEQKLDVHLNAATLSLFRLNAIVNWGPDDHRMLEMCTYPNYAAITEKGREFVEMCELLQEYAALQLGGEGNKGTSTE